MKQQRDSPVLDRDEGEGCSALVMLVTVREGRSAKKVGEQESSLGVAGKENLRREHVAPGVSTSSMLLYSL